MTSVSQLSHLVANNREDVIVTLTRVRIPLGTDPSFPFWSIDGPSPGTLTNADRLPLPAGDGSDGSLHYGSAPPDRKLSKSPPSPPRPWTRQAMAGAGGFDGHAPPPRGRKEPHRDVLGRVPHPTPATEPSGLTD